MESMKVTGVDIMGIRRKMIYKYSLATLFLLMAGMGYCLPARAMQQQSHSALFTQNLKKNEYHAGVLKKVISVDLNNAPFERGLRIIAKKAGLKLVFSEDIIPAQKSVSLHKKNIKLEDALWALLAGTDLRFGISSHDHLVVMKSSEKDEKAEKQIRQLETVSGTVTDATSGEALPSVNIKVKGTTTGTFTNDEGQYELSVPSLQDTLVFSFVGYQQKQVLINGRTEINVKLVSEALTGEEVVVVGYGTQKKSDLTGSVGTVSSGEITKRSDINVNDALQGKVAGVTVYKGSGAPGRAPKVRIRGFNSINAGLDPLYVVDGVTGVDPNLIDPNNIESMEVLKDASATAIYGARGSNGVILITTKRGTSNNMEITYKSNIANRRLYRHIETLNSEEYMKIYNQAYDNAQKFDPQGYADGKYEHFHPKDLPRLFNENGNPRYNTNWQDELYAPTWSHNQHLSIRGGDDKTTYSISGGYSNVNGIMAYSNYKRYIGEFTLDTQQKSWLNFGGSLTASKDKEHDVDSGNGGFNPSRMALEELPLVPVKFPNGDPGSNKYVPNTEGSPNPLNVAKNRYWDRNKFNVRGNVYADIQLFKSLQFKTTFSAILGNDKTNFYSSKNLNRISSPEGDASVDEINQYYWQSENFFTWKPTIGQDHSLKALVGFSWLQNHSEGLNVAASGFLDDYYQWKNISAANIISKNNVGGIVSEYSLNSYFARFNYSYKDRYLLTLTGRYDGSSKFGENNKYAFFPSVGLGWRISEEPFMQPAEFISNLKIRLSAGSTGNQDIGSYNSLQFLGTSSVLFANGLQTGLKQSSFGNPNLKWETTDQYNLGLELGFLNDRIQMETDFYYKKTRNLLFNRPLPWTTGLNSVTQNIGDLENRGLEISLTTRNIIGKKLNWSTNLNWSANRNKVLKLGQNNEDIYPEPHFVGANETILRVGEPIGSFVGYERLGTWNIDEAEEAAKYGLLPGQLKWKDLNNDYNIDENDSKIIGRAYPLWTANISNNLNYRNFDLNIDIRINYGSDIYNMEYLTTEDRQVIANNRATVLDAWRPDHQNTDIAQVRPEGTPNESHPDTHWLEDGSFIRGQNLMLGYSLPQQLLSKAQIKNIRFYISMQNWFLITAYSGYDPSATTFGGQLTHNIEFFQYPKPRIYRLGINITF